MAGQPHHKGRRYTRTAAQLRQAANRNPDAICWRCGLTRQQHLERWPDRHHAWHAGHTLDGSTTWQPWTSITQQPPPGDWLAIEDAYCNIRASNDNRLGIIDEIHSTSW